MHESADNYITRGGGVLWIMQLKFVFHHTLLIPLYAILGWPALSLEIPRDLGRVGSGERKEVGDI